MNKQKRFLSLKNHKGIRKDAQTGRYVARKRIGEKQYCKTFSMVGDAVRWRKKFHPLLTDAEIKHTSPKVSACSNLPAQIRKTTKIQSRPNGENDRFTFKDVWELYQKFHFPLCGRGQLSAGRHRAPRL